MKSTTEFKYENTAQNIDRVPYKIIIVFLNPILSCTHPKTILPTALPTLLNDPIYDNKKSFCVTFFKAKF